MRPAAMTEPAVMRSLNETNTESVDSTPVAPSLGDTAETAGGVWLTVPAGAVVKLNVRSAPRGLPLVSSKLEDRLKT